MNDLTRPFSLDTYLADLAPLINLDCGTRTPAGVARVADIMTEKYEAIGWQVTRHQFAAECGPCLEATNAPGRITTTSCWWATWTPSSPRGRRPSDR
ncbi:hypothetical protein KAM463_23780 [Aeromonas caviae]|nr:hypothetical protein KAM463_23780 [Aeromonas caviae]